MFLMDRQKRTQKTTHLPLSMALLLGTSGMTAAEEANRMILTGSGHGINKPVKRIMKDRKIYKNTIQLKGRT
jgi:hypothetical protein